MRLGDAKSAELLPLKVDIRKLSFWRKAIPTIILVFLVGGHTILTSIMWNVYQIKFSDIFETNIYAQTPAQIETQTEALKSSTMWMCIYFWRLLNPHSINQFILLAILYNKTFDYFVTFQFLGYLPILLVSFVSQIYAGVAIQNIIAT